MLGYCFSTQEFGLRIAHERLPTITVALEPWGFVVTDPTVSARFGLCETERVARHILTTIEARRRGRIPALPALLVSGRLLELRERSLQRLNPPAATVVRAALAVELRAPRLAGCAALYAEPYVVRDVVQHRAAALALVGLEERLWAPYARARDISGGTAAEAAPDDTALVAAMTGWRDLFSPDGRAYRSLNRTLMNLPEGMRADLLCNLNRVRLDRPVLERLVLTAILLHASDRRRARHPEAAAAQMRILQQASDADVANACAQLGARTERELRPTRLRDLSLLIGYMLDCPEVHHGNLTGLVHRAIRWHQRLAAPPVARPPRPIPRAPTAPPVHVDDGANRATARPPIALPEIDGIRFLASVGDILAEGAHMQHCIADYGADAIAGECYLFHVDHQGEQASVEVDDRGYVRQSCGPRNVRNGATTWGARRLREWGRQLHPQRDEPLPRPIRRGPAPFLAAPRGARRRRHEADPRQLALWPGDAAPPAP